MCEIPKTRERQKERERERREKKKKYRTWAIKIKKLKANETALKKS